ncbi:ABC transporter ATP-binding protein [Enterococcus florum]|nr:ABC transporter ATP-binding protein [Enterococcus florum]
MENLSTTQALQTLFRAIRMLYKFKRSLLFIMCIKTLIEGMITPLLLVVMQQAINNIQTKTGNFTIIIWMFCFYFLIKILFEIFDTWLNVYTEKVQSLFSKDIELRIYDKISSMDLEDFENHETYDLLRRAQTQRGENIVSFFKEFMGILRELINCAGMLIILVRFNIVLVFLVTLIPIVQYFFSLKIGKEQFSTMVARTSKERKVWYIDYLFTTGNAFKELKLFNFESFLKIQYEKLKKIIITQDIKIAKKYANNSLLFTTFDLISSFGLYVYIGYKTFSSIILIGDMTTYINGIDSVKNSVSSCIQAASNITRNSFYLSLLFKFLDQDNQNTTVGNDIRKKTITSIETIELKNVSYKYLGSSDYAIKNVSFVLKKGSVLGIIGKNGSGKSTLIKIILGFYKNYDGTVLVNSKDLRDIDSYSYQKQISAVFQDFIKYEFSLKDNVMISDISKYNEEDKFINSIKDVGLNDYIHNHDMILGKWFEGTDLSIGQWQKVAIARSIFKDCSMLIMDEADASLDVISQKEIYKLIAKIYTNKIGIFVSHKVISTGKIASEILVLKKGEVVEYGSSEKLAENHKHYFEMLEADMDYN